MKQTRNITVMLEREAIYRGPLVLVNKDHPVQVPLPIIQLAQVAPGIRLERQAALLYQAVMQATGAAAHIQPVSGYRSQDEQARLFTDALRAHGEAYTHTYVALPGCSEHQTGLALDVGEQGDDIDFITPRFPYHGVCQRFREVAVHHGFIQRYPAGKEWLTGIGHEPWHFRYVGFPHSLIISQLGFTLEEYVQWVKAFPLHRQPYQLVAGKRAFAVGYVPAQGHFTEIALPGAPYTVSGNNVDGFIVALWGGAA
ncbi:MAG: M15 family metallopeptidase [Ruminococcaceae bacterium]|nr:M15 family metallopeptidase [Oscillospiraceae bacterium]